MMSSYHLWNSRCINSMLSSVLKKTNDIQSLVVTCSNVPPCLWDLRWVVSIGVGTNICIFRSAIVGTLSNAETIGLSQLPFPSPKRTWKKHEVTSTVLVATSWTNLYNTMSSWQYNGTRPTASTFHSILIQSGHTVTLKLIDAVGCLHNLFKPYPQMAE